MFCSEPVLRVYRGIREGDARPEEKAFLDCCGGIVYHTADGDRFVLETERYYISLSCGGVSLEPKVTPIELYEQPGEWLMPLFDDNERDSGEPAWIEYEQTLFCGERLLEVSETDGIYTLAFEDFAMRIVPHKTNEEIRRQRTAKYSRLCGVERLLKKPCICGGEGELFLDFVSDYFVRCAKCKRATWAQMTAQSAIDEWNGGFLNWCAEEI